MTDDESELPPPLTADQLRAVAALSKADIQDIDAALLVQASNQWRKVARVVGRAMMELENRNFGVPDFWYISRVQALIEKGQLEAAGNINLMRFSEVRLLQP